jgi:hypothetical protein
LTLAGNVVVSDEAFGFPTEQSALAAQRSDSAPAPSDETSIQADASDSPAVKRVSVTTHDDTKSASTPNLVQTSSIEQYSTTAESQAPLGSSAVGSSESVKSESDGSPSNTKRRNVADGTLKGKLLQFFGLKSKKPKHIPIFPDDPEYATVVCTQGLTVRQVGLDSCTSSFFCFRSFFFSWRTLLLQRS